MFEGKFYSLRARLSGLLLAGALLLSACNVPTNPPTVTPPVGAPTATYVVPTAAPTQASQGQKSVTLDVSAVAQDVTSQVVAATAAGPDTPAWQMMPQYTLLSLAGYPISSHKWAPQIFIYPVQDLGVNPQAAGQAADLQALLQDQQTGDQLPYLPLELDGRQALHAQLKTLDFQGGQGVRYLTQWGNGMAPINNQGLLYTFQGLTADGKYYVAAVLPVHLAGLPADSTSSDLSGQPPAIQYPTLPTSDQLTDQQIQQYGSQYRQYITDTTDMLDQQSAAAYTPDLSLLDAMIQSLAIQ